VDNILPNLWGGGGIAVDPKNPQRIFGQGNSSIARSLNGGASWTDLGPMQFAADQTFSGLIHPRFVHRDFMYP